AVKEEKGRQAIVEGVSFEARVQVSSDRRRVWIELSEKTAELKVVHKIKRWIGTPKEPEKEIVTEVPVVDENTHSRVVVIPDGGTMLIPVHYRLPLAKAKDRWWVLSITPRIRIEEEERWIDQGALADLLPAVVADLLKNPRLKTTRDFYGTPGDKRFALVNS